MSTYDRGFYESQRDRSYASAMEVIPLVTGMVRPASVVDVGCGTGSWLAACRLQGIEDLKGLDGNWVDREMLMIPAEHFVTTDLRRPIRLERSFDLVISLEVAEHLPGECAPQFIDSLTGLGPVVLFSAAIPGQGGTHHVNEQWPDYWVQLFMKRGFTAIDCLRTRLWHNEGVEWWYAQNMLLFVRNDRLDDYPCLWPEHACAVPMPLDIVHPRQYLAAREPAGMSPWQLLAAVPASTVRTVRDLLRAMQSRFRQLSAIRAVRACSGSAGETP